MIKKNLLSKIDLLEELLSVPSNELNSDYIYSDQINSVKEFNEF